MSKRPGGILLFDGSISKGPHCLARTNRLLKEEVCACVLSGMLNGASRWVQEATGKSATTTVATTINIATATYYYVLLLLLLLLLIIILLLPQLRLLSPILLLLLLLLLT